MVKQAEAYRSLSTDYSQLSAENARVREHAEKVKKDLAKIKSESQKIQEAETKWTHHHSAPGKKIKDNNRYGKFKDQNEPRDPRPKRCHSTP